MKKFIFFIVAIVLASSLCCLPARASPEDQVAISVSPISVDFGTLLPGRDVSGSDLIITNTGNVTLKVTAEIIDDASDFYKSYLKLHDVSPGTDPALAGKWTAAQLGLDSFAAPDPRTVTTKLEGVPPNLNPGSYRCTIIFWAEEEAP